MKQKRTDTFLRRAAQCLLGSIALAVLTFVIFRLHASSAAAALLYFFFIVLFSLWAGFVPALCVSILAILCFDYFFTPPIFSFDLRASEPLDVVALIAFSGTASVISRLMSRVKQRTAALEQSNEQLRAEIVERKRAGKALRDQASLLDLTHDTIFVRDMNDVITYWNRGAEDLYGWKREEALGKVTHQLLQTIFPAPLDEITAQLWRAGGQCSGTSKAGPSVRWKPITTSPRASGPRKPWLDRRTCWNRRMTRSSCGNFPEQSLTGIEVQSSSMASRSKTLLAVLATSSSIRSTRYLFVSSRTRWSETDNGRES